MKFKKIQKGQSLMEMIFAIGILLIVVSAILALTASNLVGQKESESQIIANNLAREGIEAIRNIRDSNWLAGQQWDEGLTGAGNIAIAEFDSASNSWQLDFSFTDALLYISINTADRGVYSHQVGDQPSTFSRQLILDSICQNTSGQEQIKSSCAVGELKIGLKITAEVSWLERGRPKRVTLEDLLYEWK